MISFVILALFVFLVIFNTYNIFSTLGPKSRTNLAVRPIAIVFVSYNLTKKHGLQNSLGWSMWPLAHGLYVSLPFYAWGYILLGRVSRCKTFQMWHHVVFTNILWTSRYRKLKKNGVYLLGKLYGKVLLSNISVLMNDVFCSNILMKYCLIALHYIIWKPSPNCDTCNTEENILHMVYCCKSGPLLRNVHWGGKSRQ